MSWTRYMLNNTLILISVEEMAAELPREVIKSQLDPDDISTIQKSKRRKKVRKTTPFFLGEEDEGNQNYAKINENRVSNKKVTKKRFVAHIDLSDDFSAPGRSAHGT